MKKLSEINESIWADLQDRSSGEVERKEDAFGVQGLTKKVYNAIKNSKFASWFKGEPNYRTVADHDAGPYDQDKNDAENDVFGYITPSDDAKFIWTDFNDSYECEISDFLIGPELATNIEHDGTFVIEFYGKNENGDDIDWMCWAYDSFEDLWYIDYNSCGDMEPGDVDDTFAEFLVLISHVANPTTKYTKKWFIKK